MKKKINDKDLKIEFEDREYLKDMLEDNGFSMTPEELCFQLTAYEKQGSVDYEFGISEILSDEMDEPTERDYMEYCEENYYDYPIPVDEFDDYFANDKPFDIAQKVYYGDFNPGWHKYFSFDGNGNVIGFEEFSDVYEDDSEFYHWYYAKKVEELAYDDDFKADILNGTRQLLKQGY